jgi:hypothetical protein
VSESRQDERQVSRPHRAMDCQRARCPAGPFSFALISTVFVIRPFNEAIATRYLTT